MIELIVQQLLTYPSQQKEKVMGNDRIYGKKWKQMPRNQHPLGRHPFNIITEETMTNDNK